MFCAGCGSGQPDQNMRHDQIVGAEGHTKIWLILVDCCFETGKMPALGVLHDALTMSHPPVPVRIQHRQLLSQVIERPPLQ